MIYEAVSEIYYIISAFKVVRHRWNRQIPIDVEHFRQKVTEYLRVFFRFTAYTNRRNLNPQHSSLPWYRGRGGKAITRERTVYT